MTEHKRNSYSDEDLEQIVSEIEAEEAEIKSIMAAAMGRAAVHRKKIKGHKKRAKDDLGILPRPLNALLKSRKLQKNMNDVAEDVPDEEAEVFEDMVKLLGAFGDTPLGQSVIATAAKRKSAAHTHMEAEQAEGEAVLDELAGTTH